MKSLLNKIELIETIKLNKHHHTEVQGFWLSSRFVVPWQRLKL